MIYIIELLIIFATKQTYELKGYKIYNVILLVIRLIGKLISFIYFEIMVVVRER